MDALAPLRGDLSTVGGERKRVTGIEPAALCLASTRSSQLSYTRIGMKKHLYHTRKSSQPRTSPGGQQHPVILPKPCRVCRKHAHADRIAHVT